MEEINLKEFVFDYAVCIEKSEKGMKFNMVVIIDYNVGNINSVLNCTRRIGLETILSRNIEDIKKADGIILPGVGSFPIAMDNLRKYNLINVLNEIKDKGVPILGICLGMQILFEKGYEVEPRKGLGFLKGNVNIIETNEKLPHMGWNELYYNKKSFITNNIKENEDVYFVHSYMADFIEDEVISYTKYGNILIPAIVGKENILGCQFHPEKSGKVGEKILKSWKEMIGC